MPEDADPGDLEFRLGFMLRTAHARAAADLATALGPLQMSGRHLGVLLTLDRVGEAQVSALVVNLGSDNAGMARTLDDLEGRGAITRRRDATDRRVVRVSMTPRGRELLAEARQVSQQAAEVVFAPLTVAERQTLAQLLSRLMPRGRGE
jgi:DNA-binding MarR family transcriptional regulator